MTNIKIDDNTNSTPPKRIGLLDPKVMDGPTVPNTVHDIFRSNHKVFLTYHTMSTPFFLFNTVGSVVGAGIYGFGLRTIPARLIAPTLLTSSTSTLAVLTSTTGLGFGCLGTALGLAALSSIARKGENATPIPFTDEGVEQRANGLAHNFKVRIIDLSCWSGMGIAATALVVAGGPSKLKLCTGTLGVVQALSLGSALGGLGAIGCLYSMSMNDEDDDE